VRDAIFKSAGVRGETVSGIDCGRQRRAFRGWLRAVRARGERLPFVARTAVCLIVRTMPCPRCGSESYGSRQQLSHGAFAAAAVLSLILAACSPSKSPEQQLGDSYKKSYKNVIEPQENAWKQILKDDSRNALTYCYSRLDSGVNECKFKRLSEVKRALTVNEERDCEYEAMPKPCWTLKALLASGREPPLDLLRSCENDVASRDEACREQSLAYCGELGDTLCSSANTKLLSDEQSCPSYTLYCDTDGPERDALKSLWTKGAQR
jgi:hypothetical protein